MYRQVLFSNGSGTYLEVPYSNPSCVLTNFFVSTGTNDYLAGNPVAVTKRRGPGLPSPVKSVKSPVKFDVLDNTADEEAIESGQFVKASPFFCTLKKVF
jgi:hypothetical protein